MSYPKGKSILQSIVGLAVNGWFTKEIPKLAAQIAKGFQRRNEITRGGVVTVGTVSASALGVSLTALEAILNGRIQLPLAAQSDVDLFNTAGAVGQALYTNGATAAAIALASNATVHGAIILCNTKGDGTPDSADNGTPKLVAVINGTAAGAASETAPPSSTEIQAALDASTGVHKGVTGWSWLASFTWENVGTPGATIVLNRNNVVQAL